MKKRFFKFSKAFLAIVLSISLFTMMIPSFKADDDSIIFGEYDGFEYYISNGSVTIQTYSGNDTDLIVPSTINGYPVNCISGQAFKNCTNLRSIYIPSSVTSMGCGLFPGCTNLVSIKVDKSNPVFDSRNNCNAIIDSSKNALVQGCANTVIPNDVNSIIAYAFYGCKGISSFNVPSHIKEIGMQAFGNCENLSNVTIPYGITAIAESTFSGCTNLVSVYLPETLTEIQNNAFYKCTKLKNIDIPDNVNFIEGGAFDSCVSLKSISIPKCLTKLEHYVFKNCTGLKSVIIHKDVKSIGYAAFGNCTGLTDVYYCGNKTDWANIYISDNTYLLSANIHYNFSGTADSINTNVMSDKEAKRLLCFLFNADSNTIDTDYNEMYSYLTGNYTGNTVDSNVVKYSLVLGAYTSVAENAQKYDYLKNKATDATVLWLQKLLGTNDVNAAVANELLGSAKGIIKKSIIKCNLPNFNSSAFDSCYSSINTLRNPRGEVEDYINKFFAVGASWCYVTNYSKSGMYNYFEQYLNLRGSFDTKDEYFDMLMDAYYSEYRYLPSYWKYSREELDRWGEFLFELEKEVRGYSYSEPVPEPTTQPNIQPTTKNNVSNTETPTQQISTTVYVQPTTAVTKPQETIKPTDPPETTQVVQPTSIPVTTQVVQITTSPTQCTESTEPTEQQYALGDVNLDGKIDIKDVTIVQMYLAGIKELSDAQLIVADVNNDNKVGIDDATTTQKYLAKIIVGLL